MWFTETPWAPIAVSLAGAIFLVFKWATTHRGVYLGWVVALLCLAAAIFGIERLIVTDAERIEQHVMQLADAVVADDVETVKGFFSPRADLMSRRIESAMLLYTIRDDLRITDLGVRMTAENSIGVSHFRANGTVTGKGSGMGGRGATRWQMTWQREGDEWKITEVLRLHPIREGETMELLHRME